jgi:hypothetical protein
MISWSTVNPDLHTSAQLVDPLYRPQLKCYRVAIGTHPIASNNWEWFSECSQILHGQNGHGKISRNVFIDREAIRWAVLT